MMTIGTKRFNPTKIILIVVLSVVQAQHRDLTMLLENNQFKNMVIAIHESVAEDKSLINTLKDTMTKASQHLFTATRQRAYFREITILLPSTWSSDPSYGVPTNESLQFADVVITDPPKTKRSLPQARSYSGCGKQGVHVLLTKEFLTDESVDPYTNNSAKYFIHAFAQFRWGVFQEYAESGESQFYFSIQEGRADAIKCVLRMRGLFVRSDLSNFTICYPANSIDPHTGLYFSTCDWRPYPTRQRIKASIMDHQYITMITDFCDDSNDPQKAHNYEAPNKHNRLCGHRSTWDIITNTPDFSNNNNPPVTGGIGQSQLTPTFKVIRAKSRKRRAIVAMETPLFRDVIAKTYENQVKRGFHEHKGKDVELTLVQYNSIDKLMHSMKENEIQPQDSSIILITDGQQEPQTAIQVINELKHRGNDVHVIGVGDHMFDWPSDVSGYHGSHHPGTTVFDHLSSILNEMTLGQDQYVMVLQEQHQLNKEAGLEGIFYVDPSLTAELVVSFHKDREFNTEGTAEYLPDIILTTPDKEDIQRTSENSLSNRTLGLVRYHFRDVKAGFWKYKVVSRFDSCNISVTVKAKHSPTFDEDPIIVRHKFETTLEAKNIAVFCDVTRGNHPLIGLNVSAIVAKHGGKAQVLHLWDNGAGADISKDDGIYSRYITKLENGIYHVTFKITGESGHVWSKEERLDINYSYGPENAISRRITKRQVDGALQRHVYGRSFRLQYDLHDAEDKIPPSRIADLKVSKILRYRNFMALTWTAPGDDLDTGKVSRYELLTGRNIRDIRELLAFAKTDLNREGLVKEIIPASKQAGETETFLWNMGDISRTRTFAFAIRAIDSAGNRAPISNVATAGFDMTQE